MATVSEQLRNARESQKLTVDKVAEVTKFRGDHIRSVENGNYNCFSAQIYVKGFVRSYATLLKLDLPQIMATLEAELHKTEKFSEPPPLVDRERTIVDFLTLQLSRLDLKKTAIVVAVIVVAAIVFFSVTAFRKSKTEDPLKNLPAGVYQPKANSGETLPLPPSHK